MANGVKAAFRIDYAAVANDEIVLLGAERRQQEEEPGCAHGARYQAFLCISMGRITRATSTINTEAQGITRSAVFSWEGSSPAIAPMMRELTGKIGRAA